MPQGNLPGKRLRRPLPSVQVPRANTERTPELFPGEGEQFPQTTICGQATWGNAH